MCLNWLVEPLYIPATVLSWLQFKPSRTGLPGSCLVTRHTLIFTPGSCQEWQHSCIFDHLAIQLEQLGVKYLVQWYINSSGWSHEKYNLLMFPVIIYSVGGLKQWPSCFNLSPSTSYLPLTCFFPYTQIQTHSPHQWQNYKRLYCCSYLFLCFGFCALRDLKAKEPVVFFSKFPQSVCQRGPQSQYQGANSAKKRERYIPNSVLNFTPR